MASIRELLTAKLESDRRNYAAKHSRLRAAILAAPQEFVVDSDQDGLVGLTHIPTGFRSHLPKQAVPPILFQGPAT